MSVTYGPREAKELDGLLNRASAAADAGSRLGKAELRRLYELEAAAGMVSPKFAAAKIAMLESEDTPGSHGD